MSSSYEDVNFFGKGNFSFVWFGFSFGYYESENYFDLFILRIIALKRNFYNIVLLQPHYILKLS